MDLYEAQTTDSTPVIPFAALGAASQKFRLVDAGGGYFTIRPRHVASKCLDIHGGSSQVGALLQQYWCTGGDNQKFKPLAFNDGYRLQAKHSNLYLTADVTDQRIYQTVSSSADVWYFANATSPMLSYTATSPDYKLWIYGALTRTKLGMTRVAHPSFFAGPGTAGVLIFKWYSMT